VKVIDMKVHVLMLRPNREWIFVELFTDDGISGVGECSDYASTAHLVSGLHSIRPFIIGMDARNIEDVWQKLFHGYSDLNGRGYVSHLISAIDIALWDIKGKQLGVPVHQLLGGPVRDSIPLYTHIPGRLGVGTSTEAAQKAALAAKNLGFQAIKTDPFARGWKGSAPQGGEMVERLTPAEIDKAAEFMMGVREAVGPEFELLVDAHARFDVASAIRAARALEPVKLTWLEEPVPVESINALREVRENTDIPLCVGERHFTRWDYIELFRERLVDYVMPDIAWTGGISEVRRIASQAESYFIRFSPHDALGPVMVAASLHVDTTAPNLYRQECVHEFFDDYAKVITPMFDWKDGEARLSNRPGLGIELIPEAIEKYSVDPFDKRIGRPFQFPSKTVPVEPWGAAKGGPAR
jgi:galactonate dehydratase